MNFAHHCDPDAVERWRWKLNRAIEEFMARRWSDDVFRATLYSLGFRGNRLNDEFRYHEANRCPTMAPSQN
jgi:hypothetical protein